MLYYLRLKFRPGAPSLRQLLVHLPLEVPGARHLPPEPLVAPPDVLQQLHLLAVPGFALPYFVQQLQGGLKIIRIANQWILSWKTRHSRFNFLKWTDKNVGHQKLYLY